MFGLFGVNPLPNNKILNWFKLKAFADKINVTENWKFVLGRAENIVRKGKNAGYQHFFSFSHNVFKRLLRQGHIKLGLHGK